MQLNTLIPLIVFCISYVLSPFITLYQQLPWRLFFCSSLHSWCVWLVSVPNVTKYTHLHTCTRTCMHTQIVQRCHALAGCGLSEKHQLLPVRFCVWVCGMCEVCFECVIKSKACKHSRSHKLEIELRCKLLFVTLKACAT